MTCSWVVLALVIYKTQTVRPVVVEAWGGHDFGVGYYILGPFGRLGFLKLMILPFLGFRHSHVTVYNGDFRTHCGAVRKFHHRRPQARYDPWPGSRNFGALRKAYLRTPAADHMWSFATQPVLFFHLLSFHYKS